MDNNVFLSVDLGASGTKVFLCYIADGRLEMKEIDRFVSYWYTKEGTRYWDVEKIFDRVVKAIRNVRKKHTITSIGLDGWGVDFVPLDGEQRKLSDPMQYFEMFKKQTVIKAEMERYRSFIDDQVVTQFQPFNTIYQLIYLRKTNPALFSRIKKIVSIPSYLSGLLSGEFFYEFTHATTTQFYDYEKGDWSRAIVERLKFPDFLPPVKRPGSIIGRYGNTNITLPATHDTASAFASITSPKERTMIVSLGTWCLNGIIIKDTEKLPKRFIKKKNYALEGCHDGSMRIIANTPGLWFWQKIRDDLKSATGNDYQFSDLTAMAQKAPPHSAVIDIEKKEYMAADSLMDLLLKEQGFQNTPDNVARILRTILEGIAERIKRTQEDFEHRLRMRFERIHIIGGGIKNELLCRIIAEKTGLQVITGPAEGTAIGNTAVQMIAHEVIRNEEEKRKILQHSIEIQTYNP